MYEYVHFDHSISEKQGWQYSPARFKAHIQRILFNPMVQVNSTKLRTFDFETTSTSILGPDTPEFIALKNIYGKKSLDLKSVLGTTNTSHINDIQMLLKKKLIFPSLSLRNLGLQDQISIIIPDIKLKVVETLRTIFSFFNICHLSETEGEFFITGFPKILKFEKGLLIEIWFPQCKLSEFFDIFGLLFHYLHIKYYLTLTDLVNGDTLIKNIFRNVNLHSYNPLINLKWNKKDKIWMNHKQYIENFIPVYADLFYGKKKSENEK